MPVGMAMVVRLVVGVGVAVSGVPVVRSMTLLQAAAVLPGESHEEQPRHIEGRERSGEQGEAEEELIVIERSDQDLVLAEETREERCADDRQPPRGERPERPWHPGAQSAHLPHVLLAREAVDHRSRAEEHEGLEERVGDEVEDAH
jgi:hypothetical protein